MELYFIIGIMIMAAIAAIMLKGLLSSVIALGVVGQAMLLVFIFLKAPELAIAHLVVEIVVMAILVRSTMRRDTTSIEAPKELLPAVVGVFFIGFFLYIGYRALVVLPPFGKPLMRVSNTYLSRSVSEIGTVNVLSGIALDFRALDTLVLIAIIFCAVISVYAILRRYGRILNDEKMKE